jgi:hypothetical protein
MKSSSSSYSYSSSSRPEPSQKTEDENDDEDEYDVFILAGAAPRAWAAPLKIPLTKGGKKAKVKS